MVTIQGERHKRGKAPKDKPRRAKLTKIKVKAKVRARTLTREARRAKVARTGLKVGATHAGRRATSRRVAGIRTARWGKLEADPEAPAAWREPAARRARPRPRLGLRSLQREPPSR